MILLALALATVLNINPFTDGVMVESVHCEQWERLDEDHWRAENGADVLFDDGKWHHFKGAVDATEDHAYDLTDSIEAFCHATVDDSGDKAQP